MTAIKGKTVLVTGGAGGIGKLMGESCLKEGARRLVIWDINKTALVNTVKEFRDKGYEVHAYQVDVSDIADIESAAYTVLEDIGFVDILFNNAGIVVGKHFAEHTHEDIKRTVDINTSGVMHVALEFLHEMIYRGQGHIINIASASSFVPNPKMSVYAASKWAVLGWSESLRLEMEREKTGVKILTVTPSYINTGMFDGVKSPLLTPILEPDQITQQVIRAIKADDILLRSPSIVNITPLLRGILPARVFDFIADKLGVYDSMNDFKGHKEKESKPSPKRKPIEKKAETIEDSTEVKSAKDEKEPQHAVK